MTKPANKYTKPKQGEVLEDGRRRMTDGDVLRFALKHAEIYGRHGVPVTPYLLYDEVGEAGYVCARSRLEKALKRMLASEVVELVGPYHYLWISDETK